MVEDERSACSRASARSLKETTIHTYSGQIVCWPSGRFARPPTGEKKARLLRHEAAERAPDKRRKSSVRGSSGPRAGCGSGRSRRICGAQHHWAVVAVGGVVSERCVDRHGSCGFVPGEGQHGGMALERNYLVRSEREQQGVEVNLDPDRVASAAYDDAPQGRDVVEVAAPSEGDMLLPDQ